MLLLAQGPPIRTLLSLPPGLVLGSPPFPSLTSKEQTEKSQRFMQNPHTSPMVLSAHMTIDPRSLNFGLGNLVLGWKSSLLTRFFRESLEMRDGVSSWNGFKAIWTR